MWLSGFEHVTKTDPSATLNRTILPSCVSNILMGVIPVSSLMRATALRQASKVMDWVVVGYPSLDTP
jgi:hypothetical protein